MDAATPTPLGPVTPRVAALSPGRSTSAVRLGIARLAGPFERAAAVLFILALLSPHLNGYGRAIRYAWMAFAAWLVFWWLARPGGLAAIQREIRRRGIEFPALLAWVAVAALNAVSGRGFTADLHFYAAVTLAMTVVIEVACSAHGHRTYRRTAALAVVLLGVEVALSVPVLWSVPGLARLVMQIEPTADSVALAVRSGVGQYTLYTGLAIALPTLLALGFTDRGWARWLVLASCGAFAVAVALATFMGAVLLMAAGAVFLALLSLFRSRRRWRAVVAVLAGGLAVSVVWSTKLRDSEQVQFVTEKLDAQVRGILSESLRSGDQTGRVDLWIMSARTFAHNPLFGIGPSTNRENPNLYTKVGGHSSWLDQAAEYGLLGFAPFVVYTVAATRRVTRRAAAANRHLALGRLSSVGVCLLGGIYNPIVVIVTMYPLLFFVVLGGSPWLPPRRSRAPRLATVGA